MSSINPRNDTAATLEENIQAEETTESDIFYSANESFSSNNNSDEYLSDISADTNFNRYNIINFAVTNSRSLSAKTQSIIDNFGNLDLDFMTISETWLKSGKTGNEKKVRDILQGNDLGLINRNRKSRGGGVAVVFNKNTVVLKESYKFGKNQEVVCGTGRWITGGIKVAVISIYIAPKTTSPELAQLKLSITEKMERIRADLGECVFFVAGDMNRRDISECFINFPTLNKLPSGATRGQSVLDVCYSNVRNIFETKICCPVEDDEGRKSDHAVCFFKAGKEKLHTYETRTFKSRKYTKEREELFGMELNKVNWDSLAGLDPDQAVTKLNEELGRIVDDIFPLKEHKVRTCDKPWVTKRIKRLLRRKKRAFKRRGKDDYYRRKRDIAEDEIRLNRERFFDGVKSRMMTTKNPKEYYRAVKHLVSEEAPRKWSVLGMFPNQTQEEVAEKAADFFNQISLEFVPIPHPVRRDISHLAPSTREIIDKIRKMKKPNSQVHGDIDKRLVTRYAPMLAVPLRHIFCSVFRETSWPKAWKNETVTLLPKKRAPENLSELRNISCTPFFSKVLESFLLDSLRKDITLSDRQYGGKKGQGVDHMLIEIWEEIHAGLEDPNAAVNLMAVDFQKAFNRMDHGACLNALARLGGKEEQISLVASFLHDRKMSVKINDYLSLPRAVPGGAPQGSILACFLFCATIQGLLHADSLLPPEPPDNTNSRPPSPILLEDSTGSSTDDTGSGDDMNETDSIAFFRWFKPRVINDTEVSRLFDQQEIDDALENGWQVQKPVIKGYIDDFNVVEKINEKDAITHITTNRTRAMIHAPSSESVFVKLEEQADEINMKINPTKTQILCISSAITKTSNSYINYNGDRIRGAESLKILGFNFNQKPTIALHVNIMLQKVRQKLWSLRHLKKWGMKENDLLHFYTVFIRPILDFAVPTYHSQLTQDQASQIEQVEAVSMQIIFGNLISYETVLAHGKIEEHRKRREKIVEKFVKKALSNPNFGERWFPPNETVDYDLRNRKEYHEEISRTKRHFNSPIQHMRILLNRT